MEFKGGDVILERNARGYLYKTQTFLYDNVEIKTDCIYYKAKDNDCDCLTCLLCKDKKCSFYKQRSK